MIALLFSDLEFPLAQDLGNDGGDGRGVECGLEVGRFSDEAFGYVGEYVGDLEDFVDVFFAARARALARALGIRILYIGYWRGDSHSRTVFADFILVTCDLESLAALLDTDDADVCQPAGGQSRSRRGRAVSVLD